VVYRDESQEVRRQYGIEPENDIRPVPETTIVRKRQASSPQGPVVPQPSPKRPRSTREQSQTKPAINSNGCSPTPPANQIKARGHGESLGTPNGQEVTKDMPKAYISSNRRVTKITLDSHSLETEQQARLIRHFVEVLSRWVCCFDPSQEILLTSFSLTSAIRKHILLGKYRLWQ